MNSLKGKTGWNHRELKPATSIVNWVRYDGTQNTLPDCMASSPSEIVLVMRQVSIEKWCYVLARYFRCENGLNKWVPENQADYRFDIIFVGDIWAYVPEPPAEME